MPGSFDYDRDDRDGFSLLAVFRTVAPLRIGAGGVLFLQYALESTLRAWHFIWDHAPWAMIETFTKAGVPYPNFVAPATAFLTIIVAVAWMVGFFTRLFSVLFLPLLFLVLPHVHRAADHGEETACWLFIFISITLSLSGSGLLSLDRLFSLMSRPKKRMGGRLL